MKKVFFSLVAILILSACGISSPSVESSITYMPPTQSNSTNDEVDANNFMEEESMMEEEFVEPPMKDMDCEMIKDQAMRVQCAEQVNYLIADILFSEIVQSFDLSRCTELDENLTEQCKTLIQESGVQGPVSKEEYQAYENAVSMTYEEGECKEECDEEGVCFVTECGEGRSYYDIEKCDSLSNSSLVTYCKKGVQRNIEMEMMMEALSSDDSSVCDQFSTESVKIDCQAHFGIFPEEMMMEEELMPEDEMMMEEDQLES